VAAVAAVAVATVVAAAGANAIDRLPNGIEARGALLGATGFFVGGFRAFAEKAWLFRV
jgi:hypothetical protein